MLFEALISWGAFVKAEFSFPFAALWQRFVNLTCVLPKKKHTKSQQTQNIIYCFICFSSWSTWALRSSSGVQRTRGRTTPRSSTCPSDPDPPEHLDSTGFLSSETLIIIQSMTKFLSMKSSTNQCCALNYENSQMSDVFRLFYFCSATDCTFHRLRLAALINVWINVNVTTVSVDAPVCWCAAVLSPPTWKPDVWEVFLSYLSISKTSTTL